MIKILICCLLKKNVVWYIENEKAAINHFVWERVLWGEVRNYGDHSTYLKISV